MTEGLESFQYDPFSQEAMENPFRYYRTLRNHFPLYYVPQYDLYAVSRFQDVYNLLSDSSDTFLSTEGSLPSPALLQKHNDGAVTDPPRDPIGMHTAFPTAVHGAIRQAHGRPLRPRAVGELEETIRELVRARLDDVIARGRFDLVQDFAGIISASVACKLFRLPLSEAQPILNTVNRATQADPVHGGIDMSLIKTEMTKLVLPVVQRRRAEPADGSFPLVDGLLSFSLDGRPLTDDEIAIQYVGLIVGAVETLPKIIAHGLMELESRPEQMAKVRADVDANSRVVLEEMFRFCGPAQWFLRTVRKPAELHGRQLRPGQRIIALIQAAGRDEREFDAPDEFVWDRPTRRTVAFGRGPHMCIGIHLARLEGRIILEEWFKRVPEYKTDAASAVRLPSSFQWGFTSVPVSVELSASERL